MVRLLERQKFRSFLLPTKSINDHAESASSHADRSAMKTSLLLAVAAACQAGRCGATLCGYDSCGEQPLYQCSLDYCSTMTSMDLSDMGLTGTIPPSFSLLTNLASLKLANNSLTGPLPPGMGSLHSLHQLYLDGNTLTGTLPPSLGSLAALQYLDVLGNDFTGSIPAAIGSLTHLQTLDVSQNYLGGLLPNSICNLQDTTSLRLNNNYCFDETVAVDNTVSWSYVVGISSQYMFDFGSCGSTTWSYKQENFTLPADTDCEFSLGALHSYANGDSEYVYYPFYVVATQFFNVTTCNFEQLRIQQFDCPLPASCADWLSAQSQVGSCFVDYAVVEDMDTQLSVVASDVDEQSATIDSLQQTVSEQATAIASLQSNGDTLLQTVSEQAATIASLQSDAEALLQTTSEQATAIASLQTNADSMDQAFSEQAVTIEALRAANSTLQQTLSAHAATIMSLQSDGDARQQTLSAQATTIVSLQSENDVLQQTVSEQQATIALLQSDIEDAQQTVSDQASTIASMQGDVDDAQLTVHELESNVTAMQISLASVHDFVLRMNWTFTQQLLPSNFVPASTNPPPCTNDADADGHDAMPCVSTTATTPAATPESTMPIRSVVMTTAPAVHSATSTHNVILFSSIAGVGVVCIATIVTVVLCVKRHGKYSPGSTAGKGATTDGVLQQREIMMQNIVTRDISTLILTKSTIDFSENARCIGAGGAGRVFEACTRKGRTAPNGVFVAKGTAVVRSCMWL